MRGFPLAGGLCVAAGLVVGLALGSFVIAPPRAGMAHADNAELLEVLREERRNQVELLAALETLRRTPGLQGEAEAWGRVEDWPERADGGAEVPRRTIVPSGSDTVLDEVRRLLASQGPVGSAEEARQLDALPRTPPNVAAIDQVLRDWPQAHAQLHFIGVEQVVARFGFPQSVTVDGPYLVWEFEGSSTEGDRADVLYFKITRNRVVQTGKLRR